MNSFRKLKQLSADERRLLTQALALLPLTFCGVYALGVTRWQRFLTRLASFGTSANRSSNPTSALRSPLVSGDTRTSEQAKVIARAVKIAAERGLFQANCLQQTLVLWCLLRRNHIEGEIRFGARKQEGEVQAHAWVELDGVALNEASDVCLHFSPLAGDHGTAQIPEMPTAS